MAVLAHVNICSCSATSHQCMSYISEQESMPNFCRLRYTHCRAWCIEGASQGTGVPQSELHALLSSQTTLCQIDVLVNKEITCICCRLQLDPHLKHLVTLADQPLHLLICTVEPERGLSQEQYQSVCYLWPTTACASKPCS